MRLSLRGSVAGCVSRPSLTITRRMLCTRTNSISNMSPTIKNRLWNPAFGIRFSPKAEHQPSYPFLDINRFVHTPASSSGAVRNEGAEIDEFSDDEEFERDAAEWFDQQDRLEFPVIESISEGTQVATDTDGNLIDASKQDAATTETVTIAPPLTSLDYTIDIDQWKAARKCKQGSQESFWTYRMYRRIQENGEEQKVKVHYCTSKQTMESVCQRYFADEKVIGFDLEWLIRQKNRNPRINVSLIQIASPSRIGLFHIALFPKDDFVAPTFKKIMEDESVTKVGVAIKGDCTRLKNNLGIESKGVLELSHLFRLVKYSKSGELNRINKVMVNLAAQTQEVLGLPLFKGDDVRSGNWMLRLSERQISYSASDAYVGLQLYHVLEQERLKLQPTPPRPEFVEKGLPIKFLAADDVDESDDTSESGDSEIISDIEAELNGWETELTQRPTTSTTNKTKSTTRKTKPDEKKEVQDTRDLRIIVAEDHAVQYRNETHVVRVAMSSLRTYFLWHDNKGLKPESIAALLRTPPLKTNTVVTYILEAILGEKLPYDKTRLREEVLVHLSPQARLSNRYRALVEAAQDSEEEL
ncbi:werner syndrome atp-dependent helicase [Fusarium langsethiae]|uniref:Werner syndrome atp-dependent helicase n=1 Tax=Fusarium langsethiae TaxID=179993 RepID=A0A0M9F5R8_FUSLA|nr:werner syndrome atp-dependent helicase [Fusarium langsethiae]